MRQKLLQRLEAMNHPLPGDLVLHTNVSQERWTLLAYSLKWHCALILCVRLPCLSLPKVEEVDLEMVSACIQLDQWRVR